MNLCHRNILHTRRPLYLMLVPASSTDSCYLIAMEDDSISGIYNTLQECAKISKWAGGIGLHIHNVRATGSHIVVQMEPVMELLTEYLMKRHAMLIRWR